MIVLLGVLRGHHDALLGWMKISVFERGDAPAPGHRGTQQGVQRSSCGAWEVRVRGLATHRQPRVDSAENGNPPAMPPLPRSLLTCSLDTLSENQVPDPCPPSAERWVDCIASTQTCFWTEFRSQAWRGKR